jgi:xanthine dehydrogenase molybdenum-binding subunit
MRSFWFYYPLCEYQNQDVPNIEPLVIETNDEFGPFGAKGIGEPGLVPTAPAIANAVYDAVGVRIKDLPITQEKVPLLLGAYQSGVSKSTSFVAERYKIPYVCAESSSAELTERGLKYFFRIAPTDARTPSPSLTFWMR